MDACEVLTSVLRLHYQPAAGTLLSSTSALLTITHNEPVAGVTREEWRYAGLDFSYSQPYEGGALVSWSPSRQRKAVFRSKDDQLILELYVSGTLCKVLSLSKSHSQVVTAPVIGRPCWSSDEEHLAYFAEVKPAKAASFWSSEDSGRGQQYLYKESLGDGLELVSKPTLWVYDCQANAVREVECAEGLHPAQADFSPVAGELVHVGYRRGAYLRGVSSNVNRYTTLFRYSLQTGASTAIPFPDRFMAVVHPRYSADGRKVAYYGVPHTTSYSTSVVLCLYDTETGTHTVVLDLVNSRNPRFNGVYGYHPVLRKMRWVGEGLIALESHFEGGVAVFVTDLKGNVREVEVPVQRPYCAEVLDVAFGCVLVKVSNVTTYPKVYIAQVSPEGCSLQLLSDPPAAAVSPSDSHVLSTLASVRCTPIHHSEVTSFLYWTKRDLPLCVVLHGGPHNTGYAHMNAEATFLLSQGFNVLMANYRGTTGFGLDTLNALTGHIGEVDLGDVLAAVDQARTEVGCTKVYSIGGSHGGFLSAHLACTGRVHGSVVKNGVCSVLDMLYASDTPDWAPGTALGKETPHPAGDQDLLQMYHASPLARAAAVSCPVLLVVGELDVCVPCFSSVNFYKVLKHNGVDTTMLWYPKDRHILATPSTQYDLLLNEVLWLQSKLT